VVPLTVDAVQEAEVICGQAATALAAALEHSDVDVRGVAAWVLANVRVSSTPAGSGSRAAIGFATDSPLEEAGFEPSVPP
jgi:hypothetical protein